MGQSVSRHRGGGDHAPHTTHHRPQDHRLTPRYHIMKQILLLCLLGLTSCRKEGSGHFFSDDSDEDYSYEGSADELNLGSSEDLILRPDNKLDQEEAAFGIHFSKEIIEEDDDEDVDYYLDDYEEENLILNPDPARDSVLKLVPQIEIKPKPSLIENEFSELKTSHILIMIGSACVSFGVIMLTFFFCKRSMEQKQEKIQSVAVKKEKFEPSPIVKDYQRVPTDTKEYLETREETHIEMYKESNQETPATSEPLISS